MRGAIVLGVWSLAQWCAQLQSLLGCKYASDCSFDPNGRMDLLLVRSPGSTCIKKRSMVATGQVALNNRMVAVLWSFCIASCR
jgi:hypothetical protein